MSEFTRKLREMMDRCPADVGVTALDAEEVRLFDALDARVRALEESTSSSAWAVELARDNLRMAERVRALENKRPLLERLEDEVRRIKPGTNVDPDVVIAPGTSRLSPEEAKFRGMSGSAQLGFLAQMKAAQEAAVLAERERCAKVAEKHSCDARCDVDIDGGGGCYILIAAEIRRGE